MSLRDRLLRPRGNRVWDAVVRGTGLVGLIAIPLSLVWVDVAALAGFVIITIAVNGPLSPLLPATYEPILMLMGRVYDPLLVATVGMIGIMYIEFLNYTLYRAALHHPHAHRLRESRVVRAVVALFDRSPFFAVWLCSWSPLPHWAARAAGGVARYPTHRFLLATFLGRMPRLWFFAALGEILPIPTVFLIGLTITMIVIAVIVSTVGARIRARRARAAGTPAEPATRRDAPEAAPREYPPRAASADPHRS